MMSLTISICKACGHHCTPEDFTEDIDYCSFHMKVCCPNCDVDLDNMDVTEAEDGTLLVTCELTEELEELNNRPNIMEGNSSVH